MWRHASGEPPTSSLLPGGRPPPPPPQHRYSEHCTTNLYTLLQHSVTKIKLSLQEPKLSMCYACRVSSASRGLAVAASVAGQRWVGQGACGRDTAGQHLHARTSPHPAPIIPEARARHPPPLSTGRCLSISPWHNGCLGTGPPRVSTHLPGRPHLPTRFIRPAARITFLFTVHTAAPAPDLLESAFTPASSLPQHPLLSLPLLTLLPIVLSLTLTSSCHVNSARCLTNHTITVHHHTWRHRVQTPLIKPVPS